jgi:hypothetical protein
MDDPLGDALMIEVEDLLTDEILKQSRTPRPGLQAVLVVRNRHAMIGRQHVSARCLLMGLTAIAGRSLDVLARHDALLKGWRQCRAIG